nr:bifunctional serine/threonine-protein kinase/formylglycine-generating enzyme family protein [Gemmatimonadota bacterium]
AGGFAVVYLVRDLSLRRQLAVKVLSPDLIQSQSVLERFRREAETVAQLSHPNIVPLHFVGQKDDLVYLVMQMIDGGTLANRLELDGQLSISECIRILCEIAGALAHAHKRGVIHRDIKPENVLLDAETGRALVTDFGIARTVEAGPLTSAGMVVGTAAYLSPEQATGEPSDHRSDIYALGVLTYQMLTGRMPFTGATPAAILMKRFAGPPEPLENLRPDAPESLVNLVSSCLAIDPAERISNAADVIRILQGASPVSGGYTSTRRITGTRPSSSRRVVVSVAALLLLAIVVTALVIRSAGTNEPVRQGVSPGPATRATPIDEGMILVPAGSYEIGHPNGPKESQPAHRVSLAAFGVGQHEVTVGEYEKFVQAGRTPAPWKNRAALRDDDPVTGVTWAEAASYCAWKHPDGGRLPREEEWEAAARGTDGRMYPWGNAWDASATNTGSRQNSPARVSSYPRGRTPLGIDDLIGNVWEWTASQYKPYSSSSTESGSLYVIRGGAFNSYDQIATSVFRGRAQPAAAREDLSATGFRCVMNARTGIS